MIIKIKHSFLSLYLLLQEFTLSRSVSFSLLSFSSGTRSTLYLTKEILGIWNLSFSFFLNIFLSLFSTLFFLSTKLPARAHPYFPKVFFIHHVLALTLSFFLPHSLSFICLSFFQNLFSLSTNVLAVALCSLFCLLTNAPALCPSLLPESMFYSSCSYSYSYFLSLSPFICLSNFNIFSVSLRMY